MNIINLYKLHQQQKESTSICNLKHQIGARFDFMAKRCWTSDVQRTRCPIRLCDGVFSIIISHCISICGFIAVFRRVCYHQSIVDLIKYLDPHKLDHIQIVCIISPMSFLDQQSLSIKLRTRRLQSINRLSYAVRLPAIAMLF